MGDSNSTLVYSTASGRIKPPLPPTGRDETVKGDGIVRIQRQSQGRKGKGVCVISGLDLDTAALQKLATELKKQCGCGGAVKGATIEIQGDKRELLQSLLQAKGLKVKLAGG